MRILNRMRPALVACALVIALPAALLAGETPPPWVESWRDSVPGV